MFPAYLPLLALALAIPDAPAPAAAPPNFARCEGRAVRQPEAEETARCFDETGETLRRADEAGARLRKLARQHPGSPWLLLFLAYHDNAHASELFRQAVAGFADRREAKGEVLARANLYRLLYKAGRMDEARAQVQQALAVAKASGRPEVIARARILQAQYLWGVGKDLETAYLTLRRAEAVLFPNGNYYLKRDCLSALGNLSLGLGHYREGLDAFRRMTELTVAQGDRYAEANARYGVARAVLNSNDELPSEEIQQQAARLAAEALTAAVAGKNRGIEAKAHFLLGILSAGEEASAHFDACRAAADTVRDRSTCLNGLARHLAASDPRRADRMIDESLELARQAEDYWSMAYAWRERMRVSWAAGSSERASADSQSALDAIEALRDQQAASSGQAEAFSTWSEDYYWLSGRLIEASL